MWSLDRLKHLGVRAVVDVLVLAMIGAAVVLVLWAYHGQLAYQAIMNSIAQQQAQQGRQAQPVPPAK